MNLADFHFLRPYWLLAFIPFVLIFSLMLRRKLSQGNWSAVCDTELLPYLLHKDAINNSRWPLWAGTLAAFLSILALAGPTWQRLPSPAFRNDSALVIALDLSRSMDAGDFKPSRLAMARYKIADILKQRKDGQTALLVYAGDAFVVTPLTNDTETIANQLPALETAIMPSEGSNTSLALLKATELLKQAGLQKGQILLVTDGVDLGNTLPTVNSLGNFRLSVLGVGTADGAPIALPDGGFLKDRQGAIVVPKLVQADLETLASAGHGILQMLSTGDDDIHNLLANLEPAMQQKNQAPSSLALEVWNDKGPWLLLLVLPLAALTFRRGVLYLALLMLLPVPKTSYALEWQDLWWTKDQQAQKAYQQQKFAEAANTFENPTWRTASHYKAGHFDKVLAALKHSKTSDDFYNKGNALAQSGKWEEALKAYQKALALDPNNADAKFNKELVEKEQKKRREEQKNQQDKQDQQAQQQGGQQGQGQQQKQQNDQQDKSADKNPGGSDSKDEAQSSEQKPEVKPEKTPDQMDGNSSEQQKAGQEPTPGKDPAAEKKEQEAKAEAAKLAEQAKAEAEKSKDNPQQKAYAIEEKPYDEKQQANEQWLKRIPDDPAGLLKRKFRYQQEQRGQPDRDSAVEW